MSPKLAPQKVASMVKLFGMPIWRHITTRAVDSLHLRTRNLQPLKENLSGACGEEVHLNQKEWEREEGEGEGEGEGGGRGGGRGGRRGGEEQREDGEWNEKRKFGGRK